MSLRKKEINLSESVVVAIMALQQALEVFFGRRVRFEGWMKAKLEGSVEDDSRGALLEGIFSVPDRMGLPCRYRVAVISNNTVRKAIGGVRVEVMQICVTALNADSKHAFLWARWDYFDRHNPRVRVAVETGDLFEDKLKLNWRAGRDRFDAVTEPLRPIR